MISSYITFSTTGSFSVWNWKMKKILEETKFVQSELKFSYCLRISRAWEMIFLSYHKSQQLRKIIFDLLHLIYEHLTSIV